MSKIIIPRRKFLSRVGLVAGLSSLRRIARGQFLLHRHPWAWSQPGIVYADSPPNYPGLIVWLKWDTLGLSNNDPVLNWVDSSGHGHDFTHDPVGTFPTYVANASGSSGAVGFCCTDFPSTTRRLTCAGSACTTGDLQLANDYCIIAAAVVNDDTMLLGGCIENTQIRILRSGANVLSCYDNDTEGVSSTLSSAAGNLRMMTWSRALPTTFFYEGATARGSTGLAPQKIYIPIMNWANIGGMGQGGNMDLFEICIYDQHSLSSTAVASLYNNYFKLRFPTMV